jgi:hypothetical protein
LKCAQFSYLVNVFQPLEPYINSEVQFCVIESLMSDCHEICDVGTNVELQKRQVVVFRVVTQ